VQKRQRFSRQCAHFWWSLWGRPLRARRERTAASGDRGMIQRARIIAWACVLASCAGFSPSSIISGPSSKCFPKPALLPVLAFQVADFSSRAPHRGALRNGHARAVCGWVRGRVAHVPATCLGQNPRTSQSQETEDDGVEEMVLEDLEIATGPSEPVFFLTLGGLALCLQAVSRAAAGEGNFQNLDSRVELMVLGGVSLVLGFQVPFLFSTADMQRACTRTHTHTHTHTHAHTHNTHTHTHTHTHTDT
jgi:hypothetical protein